MTRSTLIAVVIVGLSGRASAQTPAGESISVSGCVQWVQRDGSLRATAAAAPTEANRGAMVNAFTVKDATPVGENASSGRTEYALQGNGSELAKHVGHRVEIAGRLLPSVAELQADKAKPAEGIRRVQGPG